MQIMTLFLSDPLLVAFAPGGWLYFCCDAVPGVGLARVC